MPGTTTPEHEPFEQVTRRAAALGVEHGDVRRVPEPRAHLRRHVVERVLAQETLQVALLAEPGEELLVARPVGRRDHLRDHVGPVRPRQPLQDAERVRDQDAAGRGRRVGEHLPALVGHPGRLALDHLVRGQVLDGEQPAALQHPVAAGSRHVARVEEVGSLGAEPVEQVAELAEAEGVALAQQLAAWGVELGALRARAEDRREDLEEERLHRHHVDPLARRRGGSGGQLAQPHAAEALEHLRQAERVAVRAAGGRADVEALHGVLGEVDVDRRERGRLALRRARARAPRRRSRAGGPPRPPCARA